jgi:hypothetical protein
LPSARTPGRNFTYYAHAEHFGGGGGSIAPVGFEASALDASTADGLYFDSFEEYRKVERFDGCLRAQPWALGDAYRARRVWPLGGARGGGARAAGRQDCDADGAELPKAAAADGAATPAASRPGPEEMPFLGECPPAAAAAAAEAPVR